MQLNIGTSERMNARIESYLLIDILQVVGLWGQLARTNRILTQGWDVNTQWISGGSDDTATETWDILL